VRTSKTPEKWAFFEGVITFRFFQKDDTAKVIRKSKIGGSHWQPVATEKNENSHAHH
jgi:hypothetical protein